MFGTNEPISNELAADLFFQIYRRERFAELYQVLEPQLLRELYIKTSAEAREEARRRFRGRDSEH